MKIARYLFRMDLNTILFHAMERIKIRSISICLTPLELVVIIVQQTDIPNYNSSLA